ncbi:hypothetical protein [Methylomonas sp. MgM2]
MKIKKSVVLLPLMFMPAMAQALMVDIGFQRITNNNAQNVASQLSAQLRDYSQANGDYNLSLAADEVLFTFKNSAQINSNIAEIYFDDGTLLAQTGLYNSIGGYTSFSGGKLNPANLPSSNFVNPEFEATASFGADVDPGNQSKGINASDDILGIKIQLKQGLDASDVVDALLNGDLRLGLHVRSIGSTGGSDSFVNSPIALPPAAAVPIPAAAWFFGAALASLSSVTFRRQRSSI